MYLSASVPRCVAITRSRQAKELPRVLLEDLLLVPLRRLELVHRLERDLDVLTAALRIEGHVGGEQDAVGAEEVEAAAQRRDGADRDRVGVEVVKVLVG